MRRFRVTTTSEVRQEIRDQALYVAQDSMDRALTWKDRLDRAIDELADFHGHAIDDETTARLGFPVHKLVFEGTYLIHYRVDAAIEEVAVVRFRHGARLPKI